MTPTTITAAELEAGDYIIGDRIYANGTLHFDVSNVTREGDLIKVDCTSRPYDTPRLIAYGAEEKVTVTR